MGTRWLDCSIRAGVECEVDGSREDRVQGGGEGGKHKQYRQAPKLSRRWPRDSCIKCHGLILHF